MTLPVTTSFFNLSDNGTSPYLVRIISYGLLFIIIIRVKLISLILVKEAIEYLIKAPFN